MNLQKLPIRLRRQIKLYYCEGIHQYEFEFVCNSIGDISPVYHWEIWNK
jgi:hypothetical protein